MRYFVALIGFMIFVLQPGIAQDVNNLAIDATVKDREGGRLSDAVVTLIQDGAEISRVSTGKNGRFDLFLDFNHEYLIEIRKSGFVTKKLYVNTHNVPEEEQVWGYEQGGFIIDLFRDVEGIDYSILEKPIGKLYYDTQISNFQYDKAYTKEIQKEIVALEKEYEAKKNQEDQLSKQREQEYLLAIRDADLAMKDGDLQMAKENLLAAQGMKPESKEVAQKLVEVNNQIAQKSNNQERFNELVSQGDQLVKNAKFEEAIKVYTEAKSIKPTDAAIVKKLADAKSGLDQQVAAAQQKSQQEILDQQYTDLISKADAAFAQAKYSDAKNLYKNALGIKASEQYPKDKIAESDSKIAEMAALQKQEAEQIQIDANYRAQIDKANAAFNAGNYANAQTLYSAAAALKPQESYPNEKLAEIESKLNELSALEDKKKEEERILNEYKQAIQKGDNAYTSKNYELAKSQYEAAIGLKPSESYPKERLTQIETRLKEIADADAEKDRVAQQKKAFEDKLLEAKALFENKSYNEAIESYKVAQTLNSKSEVPGQQIAMIQGVLETEKRKADALKEAQKQEELYQTTIQEADELFSQSDWTNARTKYEQASAMKSNESYPQTQIQKIIVELEKINNEKEKLAEAENLKRRADDWVKKGDEAFKAKQLSIAIKAYTEALNLVPNQEHPLAQLEILSRLVSEEQAIKKQQEELNKQAEILANLTKAADDLFKANNLEQAKAKYQEVLALGDNAHASDRISIIDEKLKEAAIIAEQEAIKKQQLEEYNQKLALADQLFKAQKLEEALQVYTEASSLRIREAYPKDKIKEIEFSLKAQKEAEELAANQKAEAAKKAEFDNQYKSILAEADKFRDSKDYEFAIKKYNEALALKSGESYPKTQIEAIMKIQSDIASKQRADEEKKSKYAGFIKAGDDAIQLKQWDAAKLAYTNALGVLAQEEYPKTQLKEIERLRAQQAEAEKKAAYEKVIADADKFFLNKQYQSAQTKYQESLTYYSDAKYPIERLATITKLMSEMDQDEIEEKVDVERKIVEEQYDEGRTKVTIRRVIVGETEDVYKMVVHSWGGKYYFLNDKPISEFIWLKETSK